MATNTAGDTGQRYETNQTHFLAKTVTYTSLNSAGTGAGTGNATVTVGWLPPHAIVTSGGVKVITGFNDTTADDLDVGVDGSDDDLFHSACDMNSAATTAFDDLATANDYSTSARKVTCNFTTAPTGDGTAGEAVVFLQYIVPRDQ
ncbi:MAG: hypothetical protein JJ864_08535 [Rhizobiaceae bacterium]|nr:hypothetical protein [Rhizobiaceae bacterium]